MVNEMVDYMGAALGIVIIFVAAVFFFSATVTNGVAYATQRNYAANAQNLFDYILLSPGSPADWGYTSTQPTSFGLAQQAAPQYTLSQGAVLRITPMQPININGKTYYYLNMGGVAIIEPQNYYVNYTYAKQLLGINGQYEFQLTLTPAINVSVVKQPSTSGTVFQVTVIGYGGEPIAGAQINAILVYAKQQSSKSGNSYNVGLQAYSNTTDTLGQATIDVNIPTQSTSYYLLVQASSAGVTGEGYYSSNQLGTALANISVYPGSSTVNLTQHCAISTSPPCGEDNYNITLLVTSGGNHYSLIPVCACPAQNQNGNGSCLNAGKGSPYAKATCPGSFYNGFIVVAIAQRGQPNLQPQLLIAPISPQLFGVHVVYGYSPQGSVSAVTLTRIVDIGGISYVATFTYWPDVGPVYGGY
jgi:hypothetical protein